MERKYLLTLSDLIDRLSICILKKIYIIENRGEYEKEIDLIKSDIDMILNVEKDNLILSDIIENSLILAITNRVIWENESQIRKGELRDLSDGELKERLLFTHSINGVRNTAKNYISNSVGERKDLKVDCLAESLLGKFGNWNYWEKLNKK